MIQKRSFYMTVLGVLVLALSFPGFSMFVGNYSEKSFYKPDGPTATADKTAAAATTIKDLIIESAANFFRGKASIDLLVSKLEAVDRDGVSFYELQMIVNDALDKMENTRYYYRLLTNRANTTPYNQAVISQLTAFDYNAFSNEYGLNGDIYNQVKEYLAKGNVRGVYTQFYNYIDNIVNMLEKVQGAVYDFDFPETANIWKLNQECAHMLLFGQYIAQTFHNLR